jgi:DNA topoisomerase-1
MPELATLYQEDALRDAAKRARLRYVRDTTPGITRKKIGDIWQYFTPDSKRVTDEETIQRINKLAIPPAYTDVWICPHENGHMQATGRDARGRKQYRYHPKWAEARQETKFTQIGEFAANLPTIRKTVAKHLQLDGLPREKVLAAIVALMDQCNMRIGNDQYAKENKSYGLTTIRKKHVTVKGNKIRFEFTGKSGKLWQRDVNSKQIARIVKHCEEIPGQELFKYLDDDGTRHDVKSDDVNAYLQEITGQPFTAKDFRTWSATALAIQLLGELEPNEHTGRASAKALNDTIKNIAEQMGHTPAICRKCYIYPAVLEAYADESLTAWYAKHRNRDDHEVVSEFLRKH